MITIGSFDGVHGGHQRILQRVRQLADEQGAESLVITFHPHPREVIYPKDQSIRLLTSLEEKLGYFEEQGIDHIVVVPFTVEFSQMQPREYVEKFLIENFQPVAIVIGYDHRFGLNRDGSVQLLREYESRGLFRVIEIHKHELDHITISSTKIRKAISTAEMEKANALLGHIYELSGEIVHGDKIGSSIGFPTANLKVSFDKKMIPPDGVYAATLKLDAVEYKGMLYIGSRPTLKKGKTRVIEIHIFDFNKSIYGAQVKIGIHSFIRKDMQMESLDTLHDQLMKDETAVRNYFEQNHQQRTPPELAVVILNYNGIEFLKKFLPSFVQIDYPNYKLYIADNASKDESIKFIETAYPQVNLIRLGRNYGFAEGYNRALQQIQADYYAIVNSDIEVTAGWAAPLIDLMEDQETVAMCQPKILSSKEKDTFEYAGASGGFIDALGYPFCRGRILDTCEKDEGQYDDTENVFWASGAACIVRASAFRKVGGFDGDFFAHQEEIDLCWRLQLTGMEIKVVPAAKVYHVGGGTLDYDNPQKVFLNFRNNLATIIKNEKAYLLVPVFLLRLVLDGLAGIHYLAKGQTRSCLAIIRAHLNLYGWIPALLRKRRKFRSQLKQRGISINKHPKGIYRGWILIDYYLLGKRKFLDLMNKP